MYHCFEAFHHRWMSQAVPFVKIVLIFMAVPLFISFAVKRTAPSTFPVDVVVVAFNNVPVLIDESVSSVTADPWFKFDAAMCSKVPCFCFIPFTNNRAPLCPFGSHLYYPTAFQCLILGVYQYPGVRHFQFQYLEAPCVMDCLHVMMMILHVKAFQM